MKVLFIGGTGTISEACTWLAAKNGIDLYLLNRGLTQVEVPEGVRLLKGDIRNKSEVAAVLQGHEFDVVVDWIAFTPRHIETDLSLFQGRTGQYIFISSASAYQKPPNHYRITEATPLHNPFWEYSRNKIACEERLMRAYREEGFPITIVRPSYTYGVRKIPCAMGGAGYTLIDRFRKRKKLIVHGDGTSLWTLTHNTDFAQGFLGLLGNEKTIGESYHITSDEVLTWNQIYKIIGNAVGAEPNLVYIPSVVINQFDQEIGAGLLGDKAHSMVFDNRKIKELVPGFQATVSFAQGIRMTVEWLEAETNRHIVDEEYNRRIDGIIQNYERIFRED